MKVGQILYSGLGGHGSVAFSLLAVDDAQRWKPSLGFLGIEPLSTKYAETCERAGWPYRYLAAYAGKPWNTWPDVHRWLTEEEPEAVLLHSVTAILPCWWYKRRSGAIIVAVEHQQNALKRRSEWWVSKLLPRFADAVVCLTPQYESELEQELGKAFRPERVTVIPNGIDVELFAPGVREFPRDSQSPIRLGMAARFSNAKRQDCLVEALKHLSSISPERQFLLSLAGDGTETERVKRLADDIGVGDCVEFPGYLGESDLVEWFRGLDIYLHASDGETLSTSLLQAMAMRLPIVASDVPGIRNLLHQEDGVQLGVLADNSPESFAQQVRRLSTNPDERQRLAVAANQAAHQRYSNDEMFRSYDALIRCLVHS